MGAMEDFMLRLLLVCAVISVAFDMGFAADNSERKTAWIEGGAIFAAVFIVASVGSYNDYKKEEQFMKLSAISDKDNVVVAMRRGREETIHHNDIQVGDIIKINYGMNIPVDGVVVKAFGCLMNESAMTGEPDEMKKEDLNICKMRLEEKDAEYEYVKKADKDKSSHDLPSPIILSGTQVMTGEGLFMCIVVGDHSC
jgi:Ca2+ transporting ATPase